MLYNAYAPRRPEYRQWFYCETLDCFVPRARWWPLVGMGFVLTIWLVVSLGFSLLAVLAAMDGGVPGKPFPLVHWPLYLLSGKWPW